MTHTRAATVFLVALLGVGCGGEPEAPAIVPEPAPAPAPTPAPTPAPEPAAPEPPIPTSPIDLLTLAPVRVGLGTLEVPGLGSGFAQGTIHCLLQTIRVPASIVVELPVGTRVTRIRLEATHSAHRPVTELDVIADGSEPIAATVTEGTGELALDRVVRRLELRPRAGDGTVCIGTLVVEGIPGVSPYPAARTTVASALPWSAADETRYVAAPVPALSPTEEDRAPFAALAFTHGAEQVVYELAMVRARDDAGTAPLVPAAGTPGAPEPWTDEPASIGGGCVVSHRVVLHRNLSAGTATHTEERTLFRLCSVTQVRFEARDVDADGRLELDVRVRGRIDRSYFDQLLIIDAETFFTELETSSSGYNHRAWCESSAAGAARLEVTLRSVLESGEAAPDTHRVFEYDRRVDAYRFVSEIDDPHPWEIVDATESPLLHALRSNLHDLPSTPSGPPLGTVRMPGTVSADEDAMVLALLDAAIARARPVFDRWQYYDVLDALDEAGPIRSAQAASAIAGVIGARRERYDRYCSDADTDPTECEERPPFHVEDMLLHAFASPLTDDDRSRFAYGAARVLGGCGDERADEDEPPPPCGPPDAWRIALAAAD